MSGTDLPAIRRLLGEAFVDDPLMRWIFTDPDTRLDCTAAWLGLFAERYVDAGRVDSLPLDDGPGLAAVALWRYPDDPAPATPLPSIGGLLTALVGRDRSEVVGRAFSGLTGLAPDGPHAYLHFLAVAPPRQGQGLGHRIVQAGIERADAAGLGIHLETTNPANLGFYQSLGFLVTKEFDLAPDGPPLWALWRDGRL